MPYHVIKGTFHIKGFSPSGDTVRFLAEDPDDWKILPGKKVKTTKNKIRINCKGEEVVFLP